MAWLLGACSSSSAPPSTTLTVHAPPALAAGTQLAVTDMIADLGAFSGKSTVTATTPAESCRDGEIHIVVLGHEHGPDFAPATTPLATQSYSITETRCGDDGHLVVLRGGSLLAAQWAVYDLMERLGVRYFHPEQTAYPASLAWPADPIVATEAPAFGRRSLHEHTTHPIELSPPLDANPLDTAKYQKDWIAWNIKIRHDDCDGYDEGIVGSYAYDRGLPRHVGLNLLETQQGSVPVIDPDDPRPENVQIQAAIDAMMAPVAGMPPVTSFGVSFNPSEFTTAPEQATVDRLTFVTSYVHANWPGAYIHTVNEGTAQPMGPIFGVRFFDLSELAPPQLAVEVHPLMFYDLDRPAPVYGNADFHALRDFITAQQASRPITYYPETSWWLTFDLPVPLFLAPVSLEARDHDLQLLAPYASADADAATGVNGHLAFTSGQEWGYWLIDYCTARMTWDLALGWMGCLDYATRGFAQGGELRDLLGEVGGAQVGPMRDPDVLAMLVGDDDDTDTAELAGIHFHPLPPAPVSVLGWDDATAAAFQTNSLAPLDAIIASYQGWADRADAIAAAQTTALAPWVAELADALRITGLRAQHARAIYTTALALRTAINTHDYAGIDAASQHIADAGAITTAAAAIVARREAAYRYPLALSTAGDEPGTPGAVPNATIYPYRYLSRTHRLFYWTRPDAQLAAMFGLDLVTVNDRILPVTTPLDVELLANDVVDLAIAWGDGSSGSAVGTHAYAAQGVYDWTLDGTHPAGVIHHVDRVALVGRRFTFAKGSLHIAAPMGASLIDNLLPGFEIGFGTDGTGDFLVLGQLDHPAPPVAAGTVQRRTRSGDATPAQDLVLALAGVGTITVGAAVIEVDDGSGATGRALAISGALTTDQIVQLVAASGGFDEAGALAIVASTLGYTSATLPATLPISITATGTED